MTILKLDTDYLRGNENSEILHKEGICGTN
jgi:hypothetical protein